MKDFKLHLQRFADEVVTTDVEPAISVDYTSKLATDIAKLREVLGITEPMAMNVGDKVKVYATVKTNSPEQVEEGELINLTHITHKVVQEIEMKLNKYRKRTTAEAIQKTGKAIAVNKTDEKLVREVQKEIKAGLFTTLNAGSGTANGTNLQTACANLWAAVTNAYEDEDTDLVFFINPTDVAEYLGTASVTTQTAFGLSYLEGFLGMGTAILSSAVKAKNPLATAKQNLGCAYVPTTGDVGTTFGMISDETGMVGMTHSLTTDCASIDTVVLSGVKFFAERANGVFKATIA